MCFRLLLLAVILAGLGGCQSPEAGNLLNSGRDARVFNPATGRYEWPD